VQPVPALIAFLLFLGAVYLVLRPFLVPEVIEEEDVVSPLLQSQKNRIIDAIREIDMDYETGKLSDEDYGLLRSRYTAAAAEVLRRIDDEETTRVEVAAAGEDEAPEGVGSVDDEVEREIAARKTVLEGAGCPECGAERRPGDAFCGKCGADLLGTREAT